MDIFTVSHVGKDKVMLGIVGVEKFIVGNLGVEKVTFGKAGMEKFQTGIVGVGTVTFSTDGMQKGTVDGIALGDIVDDIVVVDTVVLDGAPVVLDNGTGRLAGSLHK